jgi:hypothetical protein
MEKHDSNQPAASSFDEAAPLTHPSTRHRLDPPPTDPDIEAQLERLDDLMFAAIDGDPVSLENVADAWKKLLSELGVDALEESRRQYLRRAQTVWNDLRHQPNHPPHKTFAAIEVISLLAEKAW